MTLLDFKTNNINLKNLPVNEFFVWFLSDFKIKNQA